MTTPTMSRRFGVEIEFLSTITKEQAVTSLRAAGIRVESSYYTHDTTPYWKIVTDGSCGYELVSPILEGEAGIEEVRIAAAALEAAGARVDRRCGLHVHFDARSMNLKAVKNLFKLWLKFEDVLDTFQPPSRRGNANTYCRTNLEGGVSDSEDHRNQCSRVFRKIDACHNMEQMKQLYPCRYRKLNIHSYFRHQTLEVRHHSGTTDPAKITNWIRLMARMFDAAESAAAVRNRPQDTGLGMNRMKWFFQAIDGATFKATDPTDLMTKFRQDSFNPEADLPSYCRATARASKMQTGKPHRQWPPKALVEDMLASGLIATGKRHPEWGTSND